MIYHCWRPRTEKLEASSAEDAAATYAEEFIRTEGMIIVKNNAGVEMRFKVKQEFKAEAM